MDPNKTTAPTQQPAAPAANSAPQQTTQTPSPVSPPPAPVQAPPAQPTPAPQEPNSAAAPPPPPKKGFPIKMLMIVGVIFLLVMAAIAAVLFFSSNGGGSNNNSGEETVFSPETTPAAGPTEHVAQEYPNFQGVEVDENTVAFNKVDESFRIRYFDTIYHEQDTDTFQPRVVTPENANDFEWYGLVDTPDNVIGDPKLFSFKAPPTYRSFIFIMRWDDDNGEKYEMFRFHDDKVTKLSEFRQDRLFYVPVLDNFSLGGNFVSINIFSCPTCFDEEPEILLYHIPSGETRNIGRVSHFAWGNDDNAYEYKEYKEGEDPDDAPLRKNEFFVESTNILNP